MNIKSLHPSLLMRLCAHNTLNGDHCIVRHSLRYFQHSGPVIYKSKLPAPSVSMPCESRILQSPTKEQVKLALLERPSDGLQ